MKTLKIFGIFAMLLVASAFVVPALARLTSATTLEVTSPGPAPNSGDGDPSGNQYIQPETPGIGPAPNSGDGVSDGSGF